MASSVSKGKVNLVCVAHPDDETIFFGGLIQKKRKPKTKWIVVCVTSDGSALRKRQFERACRLLGVDDWRWLGFKDRYDCRLPIDSLVLELQKIKSPDQIYTHGIVGEYGHPHHQDVSYAVHKAFLGHRHLYSVAYNSFPEIEVRLSEREYALKSEILTKVYGSETSRFLNVLPSTFIEGFHRTEQGEVEAIYQFLALNKPLKKKYIKAYKEIVKYLPHLRDLPRPF